MQRKNQANGVSLRCKVSEELNEGEREKRVPPRSRVLCATEISDEACMGVAVWQIVYCGSYFGQRGTAASQPLPCSWWHLAVGQKLNDSRPAVKKNVGTKRPGGQTSQWIEWQRSHSPRHVCSGSSWAASSTQASEPASDAEHCPVSLLRRDHWRRWLHSMCVSSTSAHNSTSAVKRRPCHACDGFHRPRLSTESTRPDATCLYDIACSTGSLLLPL